MLRLGCTAVTSAKWQNFDMIVFLIGGSLASSLLKYTTCLAIEVPASSPRGIGVCGLCGDHAMSRDTIESLLSSFGRFRRYEIPGTIWTSLVGLPIIEIH